MFKTSIVTQKKPPVQPRAPLLILKHKEIEAKQVKTKLEWYVSQQDVTVKYLLILSLYWFQALHAKKLLFEIPFSSIFLKRSIVKPHYVKYYTRPYKE